MSHRKLAVLSLILLFTLAPAARGDVQAKAAALVRGSAGNMTPSLMAIDVNAGQVLIDIGGATPVMPASNMKLVTTAAALATLGADYNFHTELRLIAGAAGEAPTLVIVADGDPGFGDPKILEAVKLDQEGLINVWVKAVRDAGVTQLSRLLVDDRVFDHQFVHPAWPANQLHAWYCAEVSGLLFNDNCLDVYAAPAGGGAKITFVPAAPFLKVVNTATSGSPDNFIVSRRGNANEIHLSGKVKHARSEPENVTLHDVPLFFAQVLADRLQRAGITVSAIGRPADNEVLPKGKALHAVETPIGRVLERCNKNSQNLFAESLFKRTGRAVSGQPGGWDNGSQAVSAFLQKRLGNKAAGMVVSDGSGMSRENRVTAQGLTELLRVMRLDPKLAATYVRSLSIAGRDGTLSERLHQGLHGQVYGKTGYIAGVSTMSGYLFLPVTAPGGEQKQRTIVFSFLFNKVTSVALAKAIEDKLVRLIDAELGG